MRWWNGSIMIFAIVIVSFYWATLGVCVCVCVRVSETHWGWAKFNFLVHCPDENFVSAAVFSALQSAAIIDFDVVISHCRLRSVSTTTKQENWRKDIERVGEVNGLPFVHCTLDSARQTEWQPRCFLSYLEIDVRPNRGVSPIIRPLSFTLFVCTRHA